MNNLLQGKIIISTRPKGKSEDLRQLFENEGAEFIDIPLIELVRKDKNEEKKIVSSLNEYNYVVFTSAIAFQFFYEILQENNLDSFLCNELKILSIGYQTTMTIQEKGYKVEFDGMAKTGQEFVEKLDIYLKSKNASILWPTGDLSPDLLTTELKHSSKVDRYDIYFNSLPKNIDLEVVNKIRNKNYDIIILTSPSSLSNLIQLTQTTEHKIVCIGQTTATAAIKQGIKPLCIAQEPNALGIFNAVIDYYKKSES